MNVIDKTLWHLFRWIQGFWSGIIIWIHSRFNKCFWRQFQRRNVFIGFAFLNNKRPSHLSGSWSHLTIVLLENLLSRFFKIRRCLMDQTLLVNVRLLFNFWTKCGNLWIESKWFSLTVIYRSFKCSAHLILHAILLSFVIKWFKPLWTFNSVLRIILNLLLEVLLSWL